VQGDACALPFADGEFDIVFSNAVIEHVGDRERQRQLVSEALRVGRRIFITTPNCRFPIEVHTRSAAAAA
jgi:SAM-dependent methyltransferase